MIRSPTFRPARPAPVDARPGHPPMTASGPDVDPSRLDALSRHERDRFLQTHPRSVEQGGRIAPHYLYGLPLHWMRDWPTPVPLVVAEARDAMLVCVDGHEYADFCLGDTAAMYGHSPAPVADAIAVQARRGLSAMLPGERAARVGASLAACFGLTRWQLTLTASDANRFLLRWARAVTGRAKLLVFDGCYHGTVDDTLVDRADDGRTLTRASLLGQVHDLAPTTVVVPFNDAAAVRAALAAGDIAAVLTEPALTNCGLVLPQAGFLEAVQQACREAGTLFLLDETHTLSAGHGGYARLHGLAPDALVVGKAIAGGLPCAVYGFTESLAQRMTEAKDAAPEGHSGIGTTLSANLLTLAALDASLRDVITPEAHARMEVDAAELAGALEAVLRRAGRRWTVTRLGARLELQFSAGTPRDAREARAAMRPGLESALHLYLLNRGVLVTPFHNMLLVSPHTTAALRQRLVSAFDSFLAALDGREDAPR